MFWRDPMKLNKAILILTVLALVLAPAALAGEGCAKKAQAAAKHDCAKAAKDGKDCCAKKEGCDKKIPAASLAKKDKKDQPTQAQLAAWAENGCDKSAAKLIAMAKDSGCEKTAALAANAEKGCDKSKAKLIAMSKKDAEKKEATN